MPKELHYFDRAWEAPFSDEQVRRYATWFPRPNGGIAGEWTPGYLIDFWTPDLLARAAPQARILILLRDPVERLASALTHQLALSRARLSHGDLQAAFQRGLYAAQLRRVLAAYPRERVLIGQYEACRADPSGQLARTYAFLGLAPHEPDAARLRGQVNPTTGRRFEVPSALRRTLAEGYTDDLAQLLELVPDLDLALWPTARQVGLDSGSSKS
jgi:hypothetical protein